MNDAPVRIEDRPAVTGDIRVLRLARPDQRNPLNWATITALLAALREADATDDIRAVVITGDGPAFSAGGDLKGYMSLYRDAAEFDRFLADFGATCRLLEVGSFVSAAMVNGTCVAGGLELVLACDIVVAAESAQIGDGHLRFGQLPGAGGSQRLVRAVGPLRAKRWLLEGDLYPARDALRDGVVSEVVDDADLEQATMEIVSTIAGHSPLAVARMKELVDVALQSNLEDGLAREREVVGRYATGSEDAFEGLMAFAEKRSPRWGGR